MADLELQLALKACLNAATHHDHLVKKINKLQEKLQIPDEPVEMSAKATAKLYLAYEAALKSCRALIEYDVCKFIMFVIFLRASEKAKTKLSDRDVEVVDAISEPAQSSHEDTIDLQESQMEIDVGMHHPDPVEQLDSGVESYYPPGTLVAVLCRPDEDESAGENEEWLVSVVCRYSASTQEYVVEECELDSDGLSPVTSSSGQAKTRRAPLSKIVKLDHPEEFKPKTPVLALYPGTTCLYPATVISPPSRRKKTLDYLLRFEDDEVPSRPCQPRFIILKPHLV